MSIKYVDEWPDGIAVPGGTLIHPTPAQCRAHGYELKTEEMREAERLAAEEAARSAPFEISKMRLLEAFEAVGLDDAFMAFLEADKRTRRYWYASTTLDSDDPRVVAAGAAIAAAFHLTAEQVDGLLRSARVGQ